MYGVSPEGRAARGAVFGFLEATTSDEENFGTAKEYLTKSAVKRW
ncbi:Lipoprotein LpqB OS=Streptomyces antimycoticus OX=68175 GN=lpqB PE=4 SV=1 [Streptomyces antimycoticus]